MNLTKKIATLGALAVVGAFTVSNAANVGVVIDQAVYTNYKEIGVIEMQVSKLQAEFEPKREAVYKKLSNLKTDAEKQAYYDKNIRSIEEQYLEEQHKVTATLDLKVSEAVQNVVKEKGIDVLVFNPMGAVVVNKDNKDNKVIDLTPDIIAYINK